MGKILLTGATGGLGTVLTEALRDQFDLVLSNHRPPEEDPGLPFEVAELEDFDRLLEIMKTHSIETVLHFGGIPVEDEFEAILNANIRGTYHIYEAARQAGVKRVVYASSVHAVGFHKIENRPLSTSIETRPDTYYGLSKVYGENLGKLYHDKFGIEVVNLRICAADDKPRSREHLYNWLSYGDLIQLVTKSITSQIHDVVTIYGLSKNSTQLFKIDPNNPLGYAPKDNAQDYESELPDEFNHPDDRVYAGSHMFVREEETPMEDPGQDE